MKSSNMKKRTFNTPSSIEHKKKRTRSEQEEEHNTSDLHNEPVQKKVKFTHPIPSKASKKEATTITTTDVTVC